MIALLGATGTIGRHVTRGLAQLGVPARALVRDPSRLREPVEPVIGDLRDRAALHTLMHGAARLLLLTPHGPDQDLAEAQAVAVARESGVQQIVKISGTPASLGPNGPTPTAVAHWRSEQRVEESGLAFLLLRPSFLMQNLLASAAPLVRRARVLAAPFGRAPIAMVDARDVAGCAVAALTRPDLYDGAFDLTGPRAVSYPDVAAALGVPYVKVPAPLAARALRRRGAGAWETEHALRMAAFLSTGADAAVTNTVQRLIGAPPRPLNDFIRDHLDAFGGSAATRRRRGA